MRSLLDLRLSRWALLLLVAVSAGATVVILRDGGQRTPAQTAALVALRERPTALVAAGGEGGAGTTTTSAGSGGSSGRAKHRSTSDAGGSGASAAPAPAAVAAPSTAAATPRVASTSSTATTTTSTTASTSTATASDLPKVGHVFEIVLSAPSYATAFGRHAQLPYLHSLIAKGTLLSGYHSLGRGELADELALVSGQAPNPETSRGCPSYTDFPESAVANAAGVVRGRGCIYPDSALTIGDQVTASGKVWHAYVADMGKDTCVHPNSDATDDVALPDTQPGYDTRHNPFIYFHSLLDLGDCANDDVDLARMPTALRSANATPEFDYLAADACADADPTVVPATSATTTTSTTSTSTASTTSTTSASAVTTASSSTATSATPTTTTSVSTTTPTPTPVSTPAGCPTNAPAGLVAENAFLQKWIPRILDAPAYRRNGVLVIAVAGSGKPAGHSVRTGALVISRWAQRGRRITTTSDPYSLLRLTEDVFGFTPLAHAHASHGLAEQILGH
jgi:hypothetical protein